MSDPGGVRRPHRRCRAMVVAFGRRGHGDDGVGPAVLDALGERCTPGIELHELRDPVRLLDLVQRTEHLVVVDSVVGSPFPPGSVFQLPCRRLSPVSVVPLSVGRPLGVFEALQLALQTVPAAERAVISIVAIAIAASRPLRAGLSGPAERAIPDAVRLVERLVGTRPSTP
ncbi:MAG: hypothetical protein D6776_05615 [Planctomycetota bacterium]|nr:MAG: hypothetical protein D6776_05615 [Planctomycetota bacterium]